MENFSQIGPVVFENNCNLRQTDGEKYNIDGSVAMAAVTVMAAFHVRSATQTNMIVICM